MTFSFSSACISEQVSGRSGQSGRESVRPRILRVSSVTLSYQTPFYFCSLQIYIISFRYLLNNSIFVEAHLIFVYMVKPMGYDKEGLRRLSCMYIQTFRGSVTNNICNPFLPILRRSSFSSACISEQVSGRSGQSGRESVRPRILRVSLVMLSYQTPFFLLFVANIHNIIQICKFSGKKIRLLRVEHFKVAHNVS